MTNLFASIARNGLRETISMLFHGETALFKRPPKTRPQYARVRRRTKNGRRTRPAVYQFSSTIEGGRGMVKTYERVDDGEPLDENEVEQFVTAKKSVSWDKRQGQRMRRKEKEKRRALELEQMAVESAQVDASINEKHHAPNSRRRHSRTSAGISDRGRNRTKSTRNGTAEASRIESGSQARSVVSSSRPHEQPIRSHTSRPRATGSTIRQVRVVEPNQASGLMRPLNTIPEDASGSPISFRQPEMDDQGSRSFVFGTPTHALGFSTSAISRPPSTAPASLHVGEGQTDYVQAPNGNIYAVDHRNESLQLVPDEEDV